MFGSEPATVKDFLLCVRDTLRTMEPNDKAFPAKKDKALKCLQGAFDLLGFAKTCRGGGIITK